MNQLKSYIDGLAEAAEIIDKENPTHLIAPMMGAVPFIDAMHIIDSQFDISRVVYMPASSRILNVNDVIKDWYSNFLDAIVDVRGTLPKVMGIDEVVSGGSVMRCLNNIDMATEKERKKIRQNILEKLHGDKQQSLEVLTTIGILTDGKFAYELGNLRKRIMNGEYKDNPDLARQDSKFVRDIVRDELRHHLIYTTVGVEQKANQRNYNYENARKDGRVKPVAVDYIITIDKPGLCPPKFKLLSDLKGQGYVEATPVIDSFLVIPEYLDFLYSIARYVGKDPEKIHPINMSQIINSKRYLSPKHILTP